MRAFLFFLGFILLCPVGLQASEDEVCGALSVSLSREEKEARVRAFNQVLLEVADIQEEWAVSSQDLVDGASCNLYGDLCGVIPQPLKALMDAFCTLTWVKNINLNSNRLTVLDMNMGCFPFLEELDLGSNHLEYLPGTLGCCAHLRTLKVLQNRLKALPQTLALCTSLVHVDISDNTSLMCVGPLFSLPNLTALEADYNPPGPILEGLAALSRLEVLSLYRCGIQTLPSSIGSLTALKDLNLGRNALCTLPEDMAQMTAVEGLDLHQNQLAAVPAFLGKITKLTGLHLMGNALKVLPASLGDLTKLQYLNLARNQLETLPASLGGLERLICLNLICNPCLLNKGVGQETWGRQELEERFRNRVVLDNTDFEQLALWQDSEMKRWKNYHIGVWMEWVQMAS